MRTNGLDSGEQLYIFLARDGVTEQECQVKKQFGHKQFEKGQICNKRQNKDKIYTEKEIEISNHFIRY